MHWSSLHKLLEETLLRLEATYAEYRQVLQIREEQFDWLEGCEDTAGIRRPTRGNLQLINEEIELHHVSLANDTSVGGANSCHGYITHTLPSPFSLLPSPFSLLPSPFSLLPSPFSLLPSPFSLLPSPFSLLPSPFSLPQQLLEEIKEHQNEAEFIDQTVAFLQEHSRKAQREEMADKAAEFSERYQALMGSQDTYVHNLQVCVCVFVCLCVHFLSSNYFLCPIPIPQDSIPIWKEFNNQSQGLSEWLVHIQSELESDRTQSGNALVTKRSLTNSQVWIWYIHVLYP